jgi:CarD family transcriptional regulator
MSKTKVVKPATAKVAKPAKAPVKPATAKAAAKPSAKPALPKAAPVAKTAAPPKAQVAAKTVAQAKKPTAQAKPVATAKAPIAVPVAGAAMAKAAVAATGQVARTVPSAVPKQAIKTFPAQLPPQAPQMPRDLAVKAAEARQQQPAIAGPKKPVSQRHGFKTNEYIVYPAHGVGRIIGIEEQEIAGMSLELFVIQFEKDKMTLRVPTGKLESVGMRKLADDGIVGKAMDTLKGRARVKRTMWSRRAQEYEAKINSGDLVSIAEVVRDLYRSESQPEQSYSERQLYEAALDRMAREIAAVARLDERGAVQRITEVLSKSAKTRRAAAEAEEAEGADVKAA